MEMRGGGGGRPKFYYCMYSIISGTRITLTGQERNQ